MKNKLLFTLLVIIIGCSNNKVKIISNPKAYDYIIENQIPSKRPDWTYNLKSIENKYKTYELFVGISNFSNDEYTASKIAEENAILQVIKYLGVSAEIERITTKRSENSSSIDNFNLKSKEISKQVSKNYAEKIILLEKYIEEGKYFDPRRFWRPFTRVYSLYGIDKKIINK
ncbi:hypothetical protein EV215_0213 [Hypnocyclicus thermotrophus]|uniref:LPP20 lipoprotein n=1 Tax=Hypnocyclicus thermotrophus TaxID=1627895 RepID=A0AA46E065_9FUSO|nr:hypothetical protein [Hypnocyclicus thermotrophus]TDT72409.1 hypothetical protein EV215_0213 [Hypnocyclicus thermotrophus]